MKERQYKSNTSSIMHLNMLHKVRSTKEKENTWGFLQITREVELKVRIVE